jgi:hypothetical protein
MSHMPRTRVWPVVLPVAFACVGVLSAVPTLCSHEATESAQWDEPDPTEAPPGDGAESDQGEQGQEIATSSVEEAEPPETAPSVAGMFEVRFRGCGAAVVFFLYGRCS